MDGRLKITGMLQSALLAFLLLNASACSQLVNNAKQAFAEDLSATILAFDDPETIEKGVPAYLILISSMIKGDPNNPELLESAAQLYSAYASGFTNSTSSKITLANRAFGYASRAICIRNTDFCEIKDLSYFDFEKQYYNIDIAIMVLLGIYLYTLSIFTIMGGVSFLWRI